MYSVRTLIVGILVLASVSGQAKVVRSTLDAALRSSDVVVFGRASVQRQPPGPGAGRNAFQIVSIEVEGCWPARSITCVERSGGMLEIVNPVGLAESRGMITGTRYLLLLSLPGSIPMTLGGMSAVLPATMTGVETDAFEGSSPVTSIDEVVRKLNAIEARPR